MGEFDPFAPGGNLKDDYDGTIRSVVFEKGDNSQNYSAHLTVNADDGEEAEAFYGLGGDWQSYDGGASVEHPKGFETKFNGKTAWSGFIVAAMDTEAKDTLMARNREFNNRGPQVGALWEGLRFHFNVVKVPSQKRVMRKGSDGTEKAEWITEETDPNTGVIVPITVDRMVPTKYLGGQLPLPQQPQPQNVGSTPQPQVPQQPQNYAPQQQPQPVAQTAAPAASAPVASAAPTGVHPALAALSPADQARVVGLARTLNFGDFVDQTMGLTQESGQPMLNAPSVIQALSDEGFYTALRQ